MSKLLLIPIMAGVYLVYRKAIDYKKKYTLRKKAKRGTFDSDNWFVGS